MKNALHIRNYLIMQGLAIAPVLLFVGEDTPVFALMGVGAVLAWTAMIKLEAWKL